MRHSGPIYKYSSAETSQAKLVCFSSFTKDQIESWSVAEITEPRLYQGGRPVRGGPNDLRLGISSPDEKCQTCGESRECQGHFGHIRLVEPVFHYGYLQFVVKVLRCICHNCGRIKMFQNEQQRERFRRIVHTQQPMKRLGELSKVLSNISKCPIQEEGEQTQHMESRGCGSFTPTNIMLRGHKIIITQKQQGNKREIRYTPIRVRNILEKITEKEAKLLGFTVTMPVDMLISTLAVGPPQIRPSIEMNSEKKAEDDITSAYVKIIMLNNELKEMGAHNRQERMHDLEKLVASVMVKMDKKEFVDMKPTFSRWKIKAKAIKSIEERLKSKEGRFRQNLMGKRVDFSARSVISPDPNLALDQLGVPEKIARTLTIPEEVTEWNYQRLAKLCSDGKVKYIIKPSADRQKYEQIINFSKIQKQPEQLQKYLNYGMVVQRCLEDGDYVLFNRQPTLHRMSMMGHRVRILPYSTFRLNLSVCTPYNADFDGDEMNMHVPQSFASMSEIKHIAHVPKQVMAPKNNAPVMGIVQDALLGIYMLTMRDTFLTREEVMNLMIWIEDEDYEVGGELEPGELPHPAIMRPETLWTGKQVISMIIPKSITLQFYKGDYRNRDDSSMIIRNGKLLSGALQREMVGSAAGGLVHSIWLQIGADSTSRFITLTQRIVNNWLITTGFTVGVADCVPGPELKEYIDLQKKDIVNIYLSTFNKYRNEEKIMLDNLHQRGKRVLASYEYNINAQFNNKLSAMQKIVSEKVSPFYNHIYNMIAAKSKGSETNLTQIMFCLGNQNVDGRRCPLGFQRRTLPHFCKDDHSPLARGFVYSSFYSGLQPHEFFFHSMAGRQGLSDTAIKTSKTGYLQRKLMKSLEDLVIKYDGTVRDSSNNLLQTLYGQDSFAPEYIERHKYFDAELSQEQFLEKYGWDKRLLKDIYGVEIERNSKIDEELSHLNQCRLRMRELFVIGREYTDIEYYCPIKISRLVSRIQCLHPESQSQLINPVLVYQLVEKLIRACVMPRSVRDQSGSTRINEVIKVEKKLGDGSKLREFEMENGLELFHMHLRVGLASKTICEVHKMSEGHFGKLMQEIKDRFIQAIASPGEAIGSLAAQSIGQPTTQMTLNTFHLAGVSDRNVTLGVPRLQQLLDVSRNIKTPRMSICLNEKILYADRFKNEKGNSLLGKCISYQFPERHVRDFLLASSISYNSDVSEDTLLGMMQTNQYMPWQINLVFDSNKISSKLPWNSMIKNMELLFDDQFDIFEKFGIGIGIHENQCPEIVMKCKDKMGDSLARFNKIGDFGNVFKYLSMVEAQVKDMYVCGIKGIKTVKTAKTICTQVHSKERISRDRKKYEYVYLEAQGTNLKECLNHFYVNSKKTISNHIPEILDVLGIEAARQAFINEFKQILKPYSIYINLRHISTLADWVSMRGHLTAISRSGINRVRDVSILRKASFEETADMLFAAAAFSEMDELKGATEKIIFGESVQIGTKAFDVMIDRDAVRDFTAKGKRDKRQKIEERNDGENQTYNGSVTPMRTDSPHRLGSIQSLRSPSMYNIVSPAFQTPLYDGGSKKIEEALSNSSSPRQSPSVYARNTPFQGFQTSPSYRPAGFAAMTSPSSMRSPNYIMRTTMSPAYNQYSNSPSYRGANSPNSGQLQSSPVYTSPIGSIRGKNVTKNEEDEVDSDEDADSIYH